MRENTDLAIIFRQFQRGRVDAIRDDFLDQIDEKKLQTEFHRLHTSKRNSDGTIYNPEDWVHDEVMPKFAKVNSSAPPVKTDTTDDKKEKIEEDKSKKIKNLVEEGIPQAMCTLQCDTTDNILDIFKIAVAEKTPPFRLGDVRYWEALQKGRYTQLRNTFDEFIAKKPIATMQKSKSKTKSENLRKRV